MTKFNVVTDGQWGSTGKGLISSYVAYRHGFEILSTTNMANAGHCQTGDTYIITNNGLEKLGKVVSDKTAKSTINKLGKYENISYHHYDGLRSINHIKLSNGINLKCTSPHRYYVWDSVANKCDWVYSSDLNIESHTFLFPKEIEFCNNNLIQDKFIQEKRPNKKPICLPLDEKRIAEYLGLLVGDGYYAGDQIISIAFDEAQLDTMHYIEALYDEFEIEAYRDRRISNKKCFVLITNTVSGLHELFRLVGLKIAVKDQKETPRCILNSNKTIIAAYLRGLFDSDGSVKKDRISFSNCARSVVEDAQQLLYILGIHSCKSRYVDKRGDRLSQYCLTVSGARNMTVFQNIVGFISEIKKEKLKNLIDSAQDQGQIVKVGVDLQNDLKKHGLATRGNTRTTAVLEKQEKLIGPCYEQIINLCENYHLVSIKSIKYNTFDTDVYDISVPGTHSYLANGCISHNTIVREDGEKFIAKAIPAPAILNKWTDRDRLIMIGPTAAFHVDRMLQEIKECELGPTSVIIHPRAGVITEEHRQIEAEEKEGKTGTKHIASTMQGCGAFLADKVMRKPGLKLARDIPELRPYLSVSENPNTGECWSEWLMDTIKSGTSILHEGSQGFSLDINHGSHYPECTSRSTTAVQNIADMGLPAQMMGEVILVIRPYPIRVGNVVEDGKTVGHSGGHYNDHEETTWAEVAKNAYAPPSVTDGELTTVTKRKRRVFTFSETQVKQAVIANGATSIALNFANYIDWSCFQTNDFNKLSKKVTDFIDYVEKVTEIPVSLIGTGPRFCDVIDRFYGPKSD